MFVSRPIILICVTSTCFFILPIKRNYRTLCFRVVHLLQHASHQDAPLFNQLTDITGFCVSESPRYLDAMPGQLLRNTAEPTRSKLQTLKPKVQYLDKNTYTHCHPNLRKLYREENDSTASERAPQRIELKVVRDRSAVSRN